MALEVLLLLRSGGARTWTPVAVSAELRIDSRSVAEQLEALARAGLLEANADQYRYGPGTVNDAVLAELEVAYLHRRVSLISLIYVTPRDPALDFAEAFRVRKEPENG